MKRPLDRYAAMAVLLLGLAACVHTSSPLTADRTEERVEGVLSVRLKAIDGNIFKFSVYNLSHDTMTLDRDGLRLRTPSGDRSRQPGGAESVYTVPAGGAHDLNVRFSLAGLPVGTRVAVELDGGITVGGRPVAVEPMTFTVAWREPQETSHVGGFTP